MHNIRVSVAAIAVALVIGIAGTSAPAQDATSSKTASAPQAEMPPHAFRLDYTLTETEGGKKIDSRQYSLNVGGGGQNGRPWVSQLQIGNRVPAGTKTDGTAQYLDVGTRINGSISIRDGARVLDTYCDVTSVVPDEAKVDGRPVLRTLTISNSAPIAEGKSMLVGVADDPNSNREFRLEVTVTELK
ncbi:MAG TPA: hypothetical protein VJS43_01595 [Candidatus Acidoferrales bacterium]|nr:hypothetical protein [Candidatus Acidoferrales bacterium]